MILSLLEGNMGELNYFKKYLEEQLQLAYSRPNGLESRVLKPDIHRITEIQTTLRILGEYEHFAVNNVR